jgi:hypothetical protein
LVGKNGIYSKENYEKNMKERTGRMKIQFEKIESRKEGKKSLKELI